MAVDGTMWRNVIFRLWYVCVYVGGVVWSWSL